MPYRMFVFVDRRLSKRPTMQPFANSIIASRKPTIRARCSVLWGAICKNIQLNVGVSSITRCIHKSLVCMDAQTMRCMHRSRDVCIYRPCDVCIDHAMYAQTMRCMHRSRCIDHLMYAQITRCMPLIRTLTEVLWQYILPAVPSDTSVPGIQNISTNSNGEAH